MTRAELEHAIRAACDIAGDTAVIVFGSQAILGQYPDAAPELRQSVEVDLMPATYPERAEWIDGAIGELSPFHRQHGFYVHGLNIEAAKLPPGWRERAVEVIPLDSKRAKGICVEAHDLAASKLAAFREKDRDFVATLLRERYIGLQKLLARVRSLPVDDELRQRLKTWVLVTARTMRG